jgi:hypothetical protein
MSLDVYRDLDSGEFIHVANLEDCEGRSVDAFTLTVDQARLFRLKIGEAL